MNGFTTVCKRELKGYFMTPVAYVFLVVFLMVAGYWPFREGFFQNRLADMRLFFQTTSFLLVFMAPLAAMRLWAEERRSGTIELLFTLPITVKEAVMGKFVACWIFLIIALLLTFPFPATVYYLGNPDTAQIVLGYIGCILLAGSYLAIGSFFSAISKSQIISLVLSVLVCLILYYAGMPSTRNFLSGFLPLGMVRAIESLSIQAHFDSIRRGVLELKDLTFFGILIAGWVWANIVILEERKSG